MADDNRFNHLFSMPIIKFIGTGVLNTMFGYAVFAALIFFGMPYLSALFIATVAGVIFNYFSFGRLVFRAQGSWVVFAKFLIAYGIIYTANAVLLDILAKTYIPNTYLAQALCVPPSVLLSWVLMNQWVYKNRD